MEDYTDWDDILADIARGPCDSNKGANDERSATSLVTDAQADPRVAKSTAKYSMVVPPK